MQEASIESQHEQGTLLLNKVAEVKVGKHTYKIRYTKVDTNWRMSYYLVSQKKVNADLGSTIGAMRHYRKMHVKVISLALLDNPLLIKLFHWIHWRWLFYRLTERDCATLLAEVIEHMDAGFFLHSTEMIGKINSLTRKRTPEEVLASQAEPKQA